MKSICEGVCCCVTDAYTCDRVRVLTISCALRRNRASAFRRRGPLAARLSSVCAWPGGAHYGGRARPGLAAARPCVRGGTADVRVRAHKCRPSLARGLRCRYGRAEGRFDTCIRICIYLYIYGACVPRLHIHYPFICICQNRSGLCMRAPVCDEDGSAVCACVGGLVLRARPKTRNPKPCEPLPVGVDRVRPRRAGVQRCVGFQREHRRVEHRACHHAVQCMRRLPARRRALWRTRSAGPRCGAAGCARRHRRCARACAHVSALA
jgi:hypothetical protein